MPLHSEEEPYPRHQKSSELRNAALDGLRGLGAIIVVFWHLAANFFPTAAWGKAVPSSFAWELQLFVSPFWVFLSGSFAVCVFFVMSGYVLTIGYFRNGQTKTQLGERILARPLRLGVLASASTLAVYVFSLLDPNFIPATMVPVLKSTGAYDALAPYLNATPNLKLSELSANLIWLPWFQPPDFSRLYNGVLWTMYIELFGSFLVMGMAILISRSWQRWIAVVIYVIVATLMINTVPGYGIYFAFFVIGSAIAAAGIGEKQKAGYCRLIPLVLAALGLYLGGYNGSGLSQAVAPLASLLTSNLVSGRIALNGIGAILFFYSILTSHFLTSIFSGLVISYFGRISFALYLFHPLAIWVVGFQTFLWVGDEWSNGLRCVLAALTSIVTALAISTLLTRWIDCPSVLLSKSFARFTVQKVLTCAFQRWR